MVNKNIYIRTEQWKKTIESKSVKIVILTQSYRIMNIIIGCAHFEFFIRYSWLTHTKIWLFMVLFWNFLFIYFLILFLFKYFRIRFNNNNNNNNFNYYYYYYYYIYLYKPNRLRNYHSNNF